MSKSSDPREIGASASAIQYHYDVGNDFYATFLDPTFAYSCGLWETGDEGLHQAQVNKIEHHIRESRASGAGAVLDIGCGWGGTLRRLVDEHAVGRAVGITLSEEQVRFIEGFDDARISASVEHWKDHQSDKPYDAIICIGAFEHFAKPGVSTEEKIAGYGVFFDKCRELLAPGGWMSLQTISYGKPRKTSPEVAKAIHQYVNTIFPETEVPRLAEVAEAVERRFDIVRLRNDGKMYAQTFQCWLEALAARREDAVAVVGEETVQRWESFMKAGVVTFESGVGHLLRITLRRS